MFSILLSTILLESNYIPDIVYLYSRTNIVIDNPALSFDLTMKRNSCGKTLLPPSNRWGFHYWTFLNKIQVTLQLPVISAWHFFLSICPCKCFKLSSLDISLIHIHRSLTCKTCAGTWTWGIEKGDSNTTNWKTSWGFAEESKNFAGDMKLWGNLTLTSCASTE